MAGLRLSLGAALLVLSQANPVLAQPPAVPPTKREFRAVWVATVFNLNWPRSTGWSTATGQAELRAIFNRAVANRMNGIILQIRPASDAFYVSNYEPWSQYLRGTQGTAPSPAWDPLAFAITEARARGLELHAWINPYRAATSTNTALLAATHIARERPDLVRAYGGLLVLDPGEPEVPLYVREVIREDILKRYDIDAIHFDDYFYPYPDDVGTAFPDSTSYAKYTGTGGSLSLSNWRRKNINDFVKGIYDDIRATKPKVQFGISPFGIWRPGNPATIIGLDSFSTLYADSKLWLNSGWVDYMAPQLYWALDDSGQEFDKLLPWWVSQNTQRRNLYAGMYTSKVNSTTINGPYTPQELIAQCAFIQSTPGAGGGIHYNESPIRLNTGSINTLLTTAGAPYAEKSLAPACTWIDNVPPAPPNVFLTRNPTTGAVSATWQNQADEPVRRWVVKWRVGTTWSVDIVGDTTLNYNFPGTGGTAPNWIAISSVDSVNNESTPVVLDPLMATNGWVGK